MKKIILFAAAAALLAACTSDDLRVDAQQQTPQESDAVAFDVYTQKAVSRAGVTGGATTALLTDGSSGLSTAGFGVFAYYTDNFDYTPQYVPNFMYNEQVKYNPSNSAFEYPLTKYWPNEHGSAAKSTDQDRVSFFAYLPYVNTDPSTGFLEGVDTSDPENQWGIMGMKRNSLQGDPVIQYITSFDQTKSVDLCWGTTGTSEVTWSTNSATQTIAAGKPWLNVRKPDGVAGNDSKVKFTFQHATAKLDVTVQTDFTGDWQTLDPSSDTKTRVWVRSIRFTGIAQKAALNLNNPKANIARWIDYYGSNELEMGESVTVYDGRKDGSEGVAGAESVNETVLGINPNLIQKEGLITTGAWTTSVDVLGVKATAAPLFRSGDVPATAGIYVIPTGEKVDVEIVYDIETIDSKLPVYLSDGETHGSTVENRILKQSVFTKLESGKSYKLALKLGMKDVKFNAEINDDWGTDISEDVYLPLNMPSYAASPGASVTATIPGVETTFKFAVTGLGASESLTTTRDNITVTAATAYSSSDFSTGSGSSNASGIAYVSATVTANSDVVNKTTDNAVKVAGASNSVIVKLVQKYQPLGLTAPVSHAAADTYTYTKTITAASWQVESTDATPVAPYVKVWVNDVEYSKVDSAPTGNQFSFSAGTLTLGTTTVADDVVKMTIKTGDAPAETVTFTVGS